MTYLFPFLSREFYLRWTLSAMLNATKVTALIPLSLLILENGRWTHRRTRFIGRYL